MKIFIMAGGKGTRISQIASEVPKPMIEVAGKSILEHQINLLVEQGFSTVTIGVGHLGFKIMDFFGDGAKFGIDIEYIVEEKPLGTAGALYYHYKRYKEELILINGDIIFDIDLSKMIKFHKKNKADITLFTHPNNHPMDSALIVTNSSKVVTKWINREEKREDYKNRVNAGLHIIGREVLHFFDNMQCVEKLDLDRDVLQPAILSAKYKVLAYDSPEYIKDMGTPERYRLVVDDVKRGLPKRKNLKQKQMALFLDRDGTINKHLSAAGELFYAKRPSEMILCDGAAEAIKKINNSGYLAIVVTNQPILARGCIKENELDIIHQRMERLLGEQGAYIDDLIYCPHHPHDGFPGEVKALKIECECRKPKPGMIIEMARKYNIDLCNSVMIGDSMRDLEAGRAAGCKTGYICRTEESVDNSLYDYKGYMLFDIIDEILKGKERNEFK